MNSVVYDVTVVGVLLVALASLPGDCFRGTAEAVNKGRASSQLAREHPSHRRISPRDRIAKSSSATGRLPSIFPRSPPRLRRDWKATVQDDSRARQRLLATSSPLYARFAKKLRRYLVLFPELRRSTVSWNEMETVESLFQFCFARVFTGVRWTFDS